MHPIRSLLHVSTLLAVLSAASPAGAAIQVWWKFDEASGTVAADSSGLPSPGNGTVVNGGAFQPAAGKFGGCLYLDGTDDHVTIADRAEHRFPVT